ncbi:hypothetical protein [Paeniglutamicibacter psychrophenolicus]|uniref:hypothetical protein n=1 Tax=Paeniglutamicibacter psychrophenolicus TaxID=257454 RepID=UPI0027814B8D|nr:hypothetical protein [Paeniglutamicibacter psychrophenolicus]MDQ0095020.1 hypothetical protein [Paeniglutamicibacter psychrophenolicus]
MTFKEKLILGITAIVVIIASIVASNFFTKETTEGLTFWASTIGTAIGGMIAVIAAVLLWQAEARAGRRQAKIDSNSRAVVVILNSTRRMKSIVGKGSVYDEAGYPYVKDEVAEKIAELAAEITSAVIWIRSDQARSELLEAKTYLTTNSDFMMLGPDVRYATRIRHICNWMEELCDDLLYLKNERKGLTHRTEYAEAWQEVEDNWAAEDRWREEEKVKAQASKDNAKWQD